ncbi:hypothetical protein GS399_13055 [Pedobacter sp. HMF7647]|uniref:Nuclear transport factor 2 family protein n=1 Tax=Hufsiella arboris TaxID=2695275 RepID=A0A7K1YBD5_9SPHI|nr:nuclear transport factor 2 family protein [Hufsiella arboris]MXV51907.1 hypothetical protein [Hufsiella arboris]
MRKLFFLIIALSAFVPNVKAQADDTEAVKKVINTLFNGMRKADSVIIKSVFSPNANMQTVVSKNGKVSVVNESVADFAATIAKPHAQVYDERIEFKSVLIDGDLASVWTPYKFYVGDKFSHRGIDSFQLVKFSNSWKIVYIIDTRLK